MQPANCYYWVVCLVVAVGPAERAALALAVAAAAQAVAQVLPRLAAGSAVQLAERPEQVGTAWA